MIVTPDKLKKEACQKEVDVALAKYGMKLDPFVVIASGGISLGVNIVKFNVAPVSPMEAIKNG